MRSKIASLVVGAALVASTLAVGTATSLAQDGGGVSFVEPLATPATFPDGGGVAGTVHADFDWDGLQDIAVTQETNIAGVGTRGYVSVMLGTGDGGFAAPMHIALPDSPTAAFGAGIVAADLIGDTDVDLAVASPQLSAILVYPGDGDGTFGSPTSLEVTAAPVGLTSGDLDGTGKPDLVTYYSGVNMAGVILNGSAGFAAVTDHAVDQNPQTVAIAAVDTSPGNDLIVGTYDSKMLNVFLNDGDGTFGEAVASSARVQVTGLWTSDFDGDGNTDVVVSGFAPSGGSPPCGSNCIQFIAGNGDGTFADATDANIFAVEDLPSIHYSETQATDMNADGRPDVVFGHQGRNFVTVGLSNGDGTFEIAGYLASPGPGFVVTDPDPTQVVSVALTDLNGDDRPDIIAGAAQTNPRPGGVSVLLAGGAAGFLSPRSYSLSRRWTDGPTRASVLEDFDNDGHADIVAITDALDFVPGNGDGTFGEGRPALDRISGPGEFYNTIRAVDFDRDGNMDVAWAATDGVQGGPSPRNLVAFGNGSGVFGSVQSLAPRVSDWAGRNLVAGDLNGDTYPDLAVWTKAQYGSAGEIDVYLYNPASPRTFSVGPVLTLGGTNNFPGYGMASADVDSDGDLDLVTHMSAGGDSAGEQLFVFLNNGSGAFADALTSSPGLPDMQDIAFADVNGDGKPDLIGAGSNQVDVMFGNGDGTFQETVAYPAGVSAGFVFPQDIDGDGILDLAVGHFGCTCSNGFGVLPGEGDGTFGGYVGFAAGGGTLASMAVEDLTGDGKPEIIAGHSNAVAQLTVLLNDSVPVARTHERSVSLSLKGGLTAKGAVNVADGADACANKVTVLIQKKKAGKWRTIERTRTGTASEGKASYATTLPNKPGSYRAKLPKLTLDSGAVCGKDVSPVRKN